MHRITTFVLANLAAGAISWSPAVAWHHDVFASGMTDQEAAKALQLKGYNGLIRAPITDQPGAYVLQNRSLDNKYHLTLCNGIVTGLSVDLGVDFRDFATEIEREKILHGEPIFRVKQVKDASLVWATWSKGNETLNSYSNGTLVTRSANMPPTTH